MNNTLPFCTNAGASSPSSVAPADSCGARGSRGFARCSRSCSRSALRPGAVSLPAEALWGITGGGEGHEKALGEQAALWAGGAGSGECVAKRRRPRDGKKRVYFDGVHGAQRAHCVPCR